MAKLPERLQGYWQKLSSGRSPSSATPDVIEVTAEPIAGQPALSRWQQVLSRLNRPASPENKLNDVEEKVEDVLEEAEHTRIAQVFHRIVQRVKPEDIDTIKTRLDAMQRGPIKEIWGKVQSLTQMVKDPDVAWKSKAVAIAALVYLVSPFDAVPDVIPFAGLADDVAVIAAVVSTLAVELEKYMTRQAEKQAEIEIKKRTEIVRITLLGSIAAAAIAIIVKLILNTLS